MSYANFIPNVYSKEVVDELKKQLVFGSGCWDTYTGTATKQGETITFTGLGKPTITTIGREQAGNEINAAEELEDTSVVMPVNQFSYYNIEVGDIDKAMSNKNIWSNIKSSTAEEMADTIDQYIANLALGSDVVKIKAASNQPYSITMTGDSNKVAIAAFEAALEKLYKNNVKKNTYVEAILPPYFYLAIKDQIINIDTNNSAMISNGVVGKYGNVVIKMSNNVANDGTADCVMIRTKKAIGFANPFTHNEPYRAEKKFADCLKGYSLYDAMVIRPKEIVAIYCNKA